MTTPTIPELLHALRKQYRTGVHTCNPCVTPECRTMVIGTGECANCLHARLLYLGVPDQLLADLWINLKGAREWQLGVEELCAKIIEETDES